MKKLRQVRGRIWLGRLKITFARVGVYFGYVNFVMILLTFYSVTGYKYASIWLFLVAGVFGIIGIGMIDYFIMLPCETAFSNEQVAKHQNPIYEEIMLIKKDVEEIKEEIKK